MSDDRLKQPADWPRMDRTALEVGDLHEPHSERACWMSRTVQERFAAVEYLRQVAYGYDPTTDRLQRILEVVKRERG